MCGICGILSFDGTPVSDAELLSMSSALVHRGPDGSGLMNFGAAGIAHRRLSIIDLAGGAQPLSNEDGTAWITFNGEIYNFREIRKKLESEGHVYKTTCDTESIVHLYEKYGAACVEHLNGMFAFAIFDTKKRMLLLARDRLGQKPLCYFRNGAKFAFASELQSLSVLSGFPRELNLQALHDYFSMQYVPAPGTIYKEVFKLLPGHTMEISLDGGQISQRRYWNLSFAAKSSLDYAVAKSELRRLLDDAVKMRMISDVPLGAFLSGGVDSTVITGVMSGISDCPVKTFTIGFSEKMYNETEFARMVAEKFGTDHHERMVEPADFSALEKLVRHYGEPYSDSSMLPTYLLSKFTRENVTVALSGDGADELFAGYYRYLVMKFAGCADILPCAVREKICAILVKFFPSGRAERSFSGKARRILKALSMPPERRYFGIISRFAEDAKRSVYGCEMSGAELEDSEDFLRALYDASSAHNPVGKISEIDIHSYLPGDILAKIDIASMACSLELRSPFMDYRVAEFAASLPFEFKQSGKVRKRILKDAFSDLIPAGIIGREKLGFGVPLCRWFREEWAVIVKERLLDGLAVKKGYLDRTRLAHLIESHQNSEEDNSYILWSMLVLELWFEKSLPR